MGWGRIYGRIISYKGIVRLSYLIRSVTTHVRNKRGEKRVACVTALLRRGIRKDHGLGIVRIERPSASTGKLASTG
jgi:hypothetical protein